MQMGFGRVLVTGGAGFIGSRLVRYLMPQSEHIWVIDNLSTGQRTAVPHDEKVTFIEGSITDESLLTQVLPQVEYIFHLACRNLVLSTKDIDEDFRTNVYGGYLMLRMAQQCAPRLKRFVYTSTASVYGNARVLPTPESYHHISLPYSASKFSVEHYTHVFYHLFDLPVTSLRLSNVYGPGQVVTNPYCGVVAKFFAAVEEEKPLVIYGDGRQTRDFTYIDDALQAIALAAEHPDAVQEVFNVGTGMETSVYQLAMAIREITGRPDHPLSFQPKRDVDVVRRRRLDCQLISRKIGWEAKHSLLAGLRKTYQWLEEQSSD